MAELDMRFRSPIWADEVTNVVATGKVLRKYEKRDRHYAQWEATFAREGGPVLATLTNAFHIPE